MEIDQVLKENEGFDSWGVDPAECHCVRRDPWVPCVLCGSIHCDGEVKRYRVEDSFTVENLADEGMGYVAMDAEGKTRTLWARELERMT